MSYILYCEDHPGLANQMAGLLFVEFMPDYKVKLAYNGEQALEIAEADPEGLALIITDGDLGPGIEGWGMVRKLRESGYEGPAIYNGGTELPKEAYPLFKEVIDKGIPLCELVRIVKSCLCMED